MQEILLERYEIVIRKQTIKKEGGGSIKQK
jgi:hypothetical protein